MNWRNLVFIIIIVIFFKYLVLKNIWHQNLHTSEIKAAKFKVENTTEIIFGIFHYYIKNQPATIATTTSTATSTKKIFSQVTFLHCTDNNNNKLVVILQETRPIKLN